MEQFNVTGMSCAACSARVEKAVKSVPGVTGCSVSLLTNSMGVEGTAEDAAIIRAVEQAGYGASPKKAAAAASTTIRITEIRFPISALSFFLYYTIPCPTTQQQPAANAAGCYGVTFPISL